MAKSPDVLGRIQQRVDKGATQQDEVARNALQEALEKAGANLPSASAARGEYLGVVTAEKLPATFEAITRVREVIAQIENLAAALGIATSDAPGIERSGAESVPRDPRDVTGRALMEEMSKDLAALRAARAVLADKAKFDALLAAVDTAEEELLKAPQLDNHA